MSEQSVVKTTLPAHHGSVKNRIPFQVAFEIGQQNPDDEYYTQGNNTPFSVKAAITTKGVHKGEPVLRFLTNGQEQARAYSCCWGHVTNCNRTYIDCYTASL